MRLDSKKRRGVILSVIGGLILISLISVVIYSIGFLKALAEDFLQGAGNEQNKAVRYDFEKLKSLDIIKEQQQ